MGWILAAVSVVFTLWLASVVGPLLAIGFWAVVYVLGSMLSRHVWNPDDAYDIEHYGKRHR